MFGATLRDAIIAGSGWLIGVFTPAVGRKVKAWIVKEDTALEARIKALEAKIVADGEAAIKKAA
jgi:hypothetical protein